ncbi:F-box/kelch-repeat protein At3g06240-like [Papaver somniferum]|uniref:F-box/kelch-repeat protein At3g06240-like n=1 Tax=Papaver somniferum TaxID=3469 RepID=UPI000E6FB5E3|nr:F-box/kelch-repeat protein At3g06240-like [Papaver somniferum]
MMQIQRCCKRFWHSATIIVDERMQQAGIKVWALKCAQISDLPSNQHGNFNRQQVGVWGLNLKHVAGNWRVSSIDCASISSSPRKKAVAMDYPFNMKQRHTVDTLGSCNGLICVGVFTGKSERDKRNNICIWNPTTREYKRIPIPLNDFCLRDQYENVRRSHRAKYGFGYDRNLEDYKLVRVVGYKQTGSSKIRFYGLGSDSWRNIQTIPYSFDFGSTKCSGFLFNGALHWLGTGEETSSEVVVSFDISSERTMDVPLPEMHVPQPEGIALLKTVGVLGDCLCLTCVFPGLRIDIWVLQNYGARDSWTKQFTINPDVSERVRNLFWWNCWKPISVFQNGEILMDMQQEYSLVLCHPENGRVRKLQVPNISGLCITEIFEESLVSPNYDTYRGRTKNVEKIELIPNKKSRKRRRKNLFFYLHMWLVS